MFDRLSWMMVFDLEILHIISYWFIRKQNFCHTCNSIEKRILDFIHQIALKVSSYRILLIGNYLFEQFSDWNGKKWVSCVLEIPVDGRHFAFAAIFQFENCVKIIFFDFRINVVNIQIQSTKFNGRP